MGDYEKRTAHFKGEIDLRLGKAMRENFTTLWFYALHEKHLIQYLIAKIEKELSEKVKVTYIKFDKFQYHYCPDTPYKYSSSGKKYEKTSDERMVDLNFTGEMTIFFHYTTETRASTDKKTLNGVIEDYLQSSLKRKLINKNYDVRVLHILNLIEE